MKSKKIWIPLVSFFVLMLIATAVSENIYYKSLPEVVTNKYGPAKLAANYRIPGVIQYGKKQTEMCAEFSFESVTLLASSGEMLSEGDPVYSLSADEVLMIQKRTELAVYELKKQNEVISKNVILNEGEKLQKEINDLQITAGNKQITVLKQLFQNEGIVYADTEGIITYSIRSNGSVQKGQSIATLTSNTDHYYVTWQMPAERGKLFGPEDTVECNLKVLENGEKEDVQIVSALYDLTIVNVEYSQETQSYLFQGEVPADISLAEQDGAGVTVDCRYFGQDEYAAIVPLSALTLERDIDGNATRGYIYAVETRERVYGEEYYVIPFYVEIETILDNKAALSSLPMNYSYVTETTKPLTEGMAVKLK